MKNCQIENCKLKPKYIFCDKHSYINKLTGRDATREKIRARDNYTCRKCDKKWRKRKRKFDVHHLDCVKEKTMQYDHYEKEKDNMITFCHKCHLNLQEHRLAMRKGWFKSLSTASLLTL